MVYAVDLTSEVIHITWELFWQAAAKIDGSGSSKAIAFLPATKVDDKGVKILTMAAAIAPNIGDRVYAHSLAAIEEGGIELGEMSSGAGDINTLASDDDANALVIDLDALSDDSASGDESGDNNNNGGNNDDGDDADGNGGGNEGDGGDDGDDDENQRRGVRRPREEDDVPDNGKRR
jgi:hypothetical protein